MGTSNYSDKFKRDSVHQITVRGYPVREVSRRLGVSTYSLYKCLKQFGEPVPKPGMDHEAENRRLKRELTWVTEERDILKEGNGALRARVPMKYAFIRPHRKEPGILAMCRVLRVHFSGFYAWLKEPLSRRAQEDARQTELIRQALTESGRFYGYRKLTDDLRDQGEQISENRVTHLRLPSSRRRHIPVRGRLRD